MAAFFGSYRLARDMDIGGDEAFDGDEFLAKFSQEHLEDGNNFDDYIQIINSYIGFVALMINSEC